MSDMAVEIDSIEQIDAMGEMSAKLVFAISPSVRAWRATESLLPAGTVAVAVADDRGECTLADWEAVALIRDRLHGSGEPAPSDDSLALRATEKSDQAFHRDFGGWLDRNRKRRSDQSSLGA